MFFNGLSGFLRAGIAFDYPNTSLLRDQVILHQQPEHRGDDGRVADWILEGEFLQMIIRCYKSPS